MWAAPLDAFLPRPLKHTERMLRLQQTFCSSSFLQLILDGIPRPQAQCPLQAAMMTRVNWNESPHWPTTLTVDGGHGQALRTDFLLPCWLFWSVSPAYKLVNVTCSLSSMTVTPRSSKSTSSCHPTVAMAKVS